MDPYLLVRPLLAALDPESAHQLTLWALKRGLVAAPAGTDDAILGIRALGRDFANPLGLAAGFDKNAEVVGAMLRQGFGFVEVVAQAFDGLRVAVLPAVGEAAGGGAGPCSRATLWASVPLPVSSVAGRPRRRPRAAPEGHGLGPWTPIFLSARCSRHSTPKAPIV